MSTSAARLAVVLLLCLPAAVACGDTGDKAGGQPAPGKGGSSGGSGGGDGGVPGPLKIPEWGRNGFLFDAGTANGRANWADIKKMFEDACGDGTLCVTLERVYRTEGGTLTDGPCGYDHMEPAAESSVERGGTVSVVGVCGPETEGPTEGPTDEPTDGSTDTGGPTDPAEATDGTSTSADSAPPA
ncbi:hypothetical protein [Streptomyces sp. NPDC046385]|uniref:hypothetical protein n=1 Tax=Streptomyces sp. NPDC046385 TaxID=3154918 RepID=UPI0033C1A3DB